MKLIFVVILLIYQVQSKKESLKGFEDLFKDPDLMFELKKRLGSILENTDDDGQNGVDSLGTSAPAVDCYALSGTLEGDCSFHSNESTIIKTTESLERGAIFLKEISNVSCARDCTLECCGNEDCDTSVYQDKLDNNCYLFKCDHPSLCVFAKHSDYWMSSMSKEVHSTHQYTPGGATPTHENELENLGSHPTQPSTSPTPTTTVQTTTPKPGLGEYCASYEVDCEDPHAECLMKKCKCHVGYHQKHGVCRKRCIQDEFECDEISYRPNPVQCISALSLCDGRRDCDDASDEANCPTESEKDAYMNVDTTGNNDMYNNPVYNPQYNHQTDNQYPYGFPIPLTNQQPHNLQPTNQLYQGQIPTNRNPAMLPANGNTAGQYYLPANGVPTNQNTGNLNIPQTGSALNGQWTYNNLGSQIYPNNSPYQPVGIQQPVGQQQSYIPQQTGYLPVQNPINTVQQLNPNMVSAQNPNAKVIIVQQPVANNQNLNTGAQQVNPVNPQHTLVNNSPVGPAVKNINPILSDTNKNRNQYETNKQAANIDSHSTDKLNKNIATNLNNNSNRGNTDIYRSDSYGRDGVNPYPTDSNGYASQSKNNIRDPEDKLVSKTMPTFDHNNDDNVHRPSSEEDHDSRDSMTYPSATKVKQQIGSPTQSTVPGQKTGHDDSRPSPGNSEGMSDYFSWMNFDDDSPRVSGKKGKNVKPISDHNDDTESNAEASETHSKVDTDVQKPKVYDADNNKAKVDVKTDKLGQYNDRTNKVTDSRYKDKDVPNDPNIYPDTYQDQFYNRRPVNNRRPTYDRFGSRFDNTRRRPNQGSRYPFDDPSYPRGGDRYPYPAWDPLREEYYYPEDLDTPRFDTNHDVDYGAFRTDHRMPDQSKPYVGQDSKDGMKTDLKLSPPHVEVPDMKSDTSQDKVTDKPTNQQVKVTTPSVTTSKVLQPVTDDQSASEAIEKENSKPVSDNNDKADLQEVKPNPDVNQPDTEDSKNSNTSSELTNENESEDSNGYNFLNVDSVQVESFTDSSQGPVVALALGLAITMMLLILVGCRLRTVKRRLRKGRALHSNEADYLINGMYL